MAYWLIKSEPSAYSWDQFVKDKKTSWTGVRNFQAEINLKAMKAGDRASSTIRARARRSSASPRSPRRPIPTPPTRTASR